MAYYNPAGVDRHREVHREYHASFEEVIIRIINYVIGVIIAFLALRFVFELFGANAGAGVVSFIYGVSDIFMAPFVAIFQTNRVAGATFDWSALVAIAIYALIGWGLTALITALSPRDYVEHVEQTEQRDDYVDKDI